MPSGGARNRSGPPVDPWSATSDRRGLRLKKLPAAGFDGPPPVFPLMPFLTGDSDSTDRFAEREAELWEWAWRTPQAAAWALEPWRQMAVAQWVRTSVVCETSDAKAADRGSLHRFADQIGLTPAGLKENGWTVDVAPEDNGEARRERIERAEAARSGRRAHGSRARFEGLEVIEGGAS